MQFQSSWKIQPCLSKIAHMCQLSIFLTGVLHMKSIFTEKMESLCLCLWACCFQACSGRGFDCRGSGGGAWQSFVSFSCICNFWPLSSIRGSQKGGEEGWGESLSLMKAKLCITAWINDQREREGSLKNFYCALMKKIFWKWLIYKIAHCNIFRSQLRKPLSIFCYRFHCF